MPIELRPQVHQDPHNSEKGFLTGFQPAFVNEVIVENKVREAAHALVANNFQGGHFCAKTSGGTQLWALAKPDPETAVHIIVSDKCPSSDARNDFGGKDLSGATEARVTKAIQKVLNGLGL